MPRLKYFAILLLCSVAVAQTHIFSGGNHNAEVVQVPEEGLIRVEKMTAQEAQDLKKAQDALDEVRGKIASQHQMQPSGGRFGAYINGEICNYDYEIKNSFLLYYQHCTPLAVLTSN